MNVVTPHPPAPAPRPRVPLVCRPEARVVDLSAAARILGCRLVSDGFRVYVTPMVLPGESPFAGAA